VVVGFYNPRTFKKSLDKSDPGLQSKRGDQVNGLKTLHREASEYYVGGASAGGRYHGILGQPLYIERASGSRVYDVEGKEYIDYYGCAGAALFGHNHPRLKAAIQKAVDLGFFMNFDSEHHVELARLMRTLFPSAEKIRLCNTGSEATLGAIRLARSYTGKDIIIKFEGHFHGMHELVWFNHNQVAGIDAAGEVQTVPDTAGSPAVAREIVKNVVFNDIDALERAVRKYKDNLAGIIMEPVSFNCGCLTTTKEYLEQVRELCDREGIVLIFDEVITGLRMRPGSAQTHWGVIPDLTTLAKGIGGGLPISAIVGRTDVMNVLRPVGNTIMSGTYSGALIPVLGSIECLRMCSEPGFYDHIDDIADRLYGGMNELFQRHRVSGRVRGIGARFGLYFGVDDPDDDFDFRKVAKKFDRALYKKFIAGCLEHGLFFHDTAAPSSPAHYGFGSQHTRKDVEITLERMNTIISSMT